MYGEMQLQLAVGPDMENSIHLFSTKVEQFNTLQNDKRTGR